jgi:hypothetical protein
MAPTSGAVLAASPQQLPPPVTAWKAASPGHLSWQFASPAQLIEQDSRQVTWQVEAALQEMLPLCPNVIEQLACSPQSTLHESPQAPPHVDWAPHASVQLFPQVWGVTSQLVLSAQAHVVPVQDGGLVEAPPQPKAHTASRNRNVTPAGRNVGKAGLGVMS